MFKDIVSSFGLSRLQIALQEKKPESVIQGIVLSHPDSLRRPDLEGLLPLHYAARHCASPEVIQLLVDAHPGALEIHDYYGWLPLHYAARKNKSEQVVKLLVAACPRSLLAKDTKGRLPVNVIRQNKSPVAYFLRNATIEAQKMPSQGPPVTYAVPNKPTAVSTDTAVVVASSVSSSSSPIEIDLDDHVHVPTVIPPSPPLPSHDHDRERVLRAVENPRQEPPAIVSVAYVHSIMTTTFLGEGFFGTVYKGSDPILGLNFAIKSISAEILRGGTQQELEDAMRTFRTEQEVRSEWERSMDEARFEPFFSVPTVYCTTNLCVCSSSYLFYRPCLVSGTPTSRRCSRTLTR